MGQEFRDWQQGHANFLRIRSLLEPLKPFGGTFQQSAERNLLLAPAMEQVRKQGGAVACAHFSNLPGIEAAIDIALGLVDAIELVTYDDPTELPSHWAPWEKSGFAQAEFPVLRGQACGPPAAGLNREPSFPPRRRAGRPWNWPSGRCRFMIPFDPA